MVKEFCSHEISLKLKELGFDEPCFGIWINKGSRVDVMYVAKQDDVWMAEQNEGILAPLLQQVIDWFREKYDIIIDIGKIYNGTDNWHFALNYEWEYFEGTYYEAREAAILKAIEVCQKK